MRRRRLRKSCHGECTPGFLYSVDSSRSSFRFEEFLQSPRLCFTRLPPRPSRCCTCIEVYACNTRRWATCQNPIVGTQRQERIHALRISSVSGMSIDLSGWYGNHSCDRSHGYAGLHQCMYLGKGFRMKNGTISGSASLRNRFSQQGHSWPQPLAAAAMTACPLRHKASGRFFLPNPDQLVETRARSPIRPTNLRRRTHPTRARQSSPSFSMPPRQNSRTFTALPM